MAPQALHDLIERINDYLQAGGLWNPELAEHDKVRLLLFDIRDELAALLEEGRDPIVMAADAAKAACILRIQRAIDATKRLHAMPLNAEECITLLEHMTWDELPVAAAPRPGAEDVVHDKHAHDSRHRYSQYDLDAATKPLHAEIERLQQLTESSSKARPGAEQADDQAR